MKQKPHARFHKIHQVSKIGVINGLWANALGKGGVLPIETAYYPTGTFFGLKLTGMQGDVMKESMKVAKTVAWNLLPDNIKKNIWTDMKDNTPFGIHIHCPEASTPKDGPSAGVGMVTSIISAITEVPVDKNVAMTGEIDLNGSIRAIGGLQSKLEGARSAGVNLVLIPKDNDARSTKAVLYWL